MAPHLPDHQVLLVFPAPFTSFDNSMTWEAVEGMPYSMVGEGGPGGVLLQGGKEERGAAVIARASSPTGAARTLTASDVSEVRHALRDWKVTMVVIPDQPDLPAYDQISSVTFAAALITAATGELPASQSGAWVWTGVDRARPSVHAGTARLSSCTSGAATSGALAVRQTTSCVLATSGPTHSR